MIAIARQIPGNEKIDYRVIDATDEDALVSLGRRFDGVLCNMALMDMAEVGPLMRAVVRLLRSGGVFVFSVSHPCFNNDASVQMAELEESDGRFRTTYSVKVSRYLTSFTQPGIAMHDQPAPHPCFHRSIGDLLAAGFEAGLVVDGLEEPAFSPDVGTGTTALSWSGRFSEIPPVLVVRMRPTG
jgi:SAM-dependent methyltransferase